MLDGNIDVVKAIPETLEIRANKDLNNEPVFVNIKTDIKKINLKRNPIENSQLLMQTRGNITKLISLKYFDGDNKLIAENLASLCMRLSK